MNRSLIHRRSRLAAQLAVASLLVASGHAAARQNAADGVRYAPNGRKVIEGDPQPLGFKQATVEQLVAFIVEASGKVVMPQQDILSRRVTVLNERPIARAEALDLVLLALQQNGIAVVETPTTITLRDIAEITRQEVPVLGPDQSVQGRTDLGAIAEKVFRLKHSSAENYEDVLKDVIPDYAKLTIDKDSNQVAVMGPIGMLQRLERLIGALDSPAAGALVAETFRLRYADAEQIKENIEELFTENTSRTRAGQGRQQQQQNQAQRGPFFQMPGQQGGPQTATSEDLRVTANTQQNSVTVVAEPGIVEQIRHQIEEYWDKPLPDEAVVPRIYDLKNSDPVKVRDLLEGLFGQGGTGSPSAPAQPGQQGGGQAGGPSEGQGVGRLAGQFSFEALPESGRLVVVAKSPDNMAVIDKIIQDLDQPQTTGLPAIVELKHASAEDLAEQLNTLLAQDGTLAQIRRSESGLSEQSSTESPFAQQQDTQTQDGTTTEQTSGDTISFWWQRSRPPTDRQNASNMVGTIRIVPVWRQNALMVLAPQELKNSLVSMIENLDRPGRQVLIAATVLEISTDDAKALGLRWSSSDIVPLNTDNSVSIGFDGTATENGFLGNLFDTSVLNANVDLNVLIQALSEKAKINILSEPKVFTGDNQEAEFFSGQDIPFITESQPNDQGNLLQSFDYRAVGIALRVRPRITPNHEVDLRVNLELSSVVPGQTLFGGAIVDRRETSTQLIIGSGQTAVISGLVRTIDSNTLRKVPILGNVPILGALFRSTEKGRTDIEVVAFITPLVVDNSDGAADLSRPMMQRARDRARELKLNRSPQLDSPLPAPPADAEGEEGGR